MIQMAGKRIVVLASGEGTNFQALIDAVSEGKLNGILVALVSDRKDCGALERALRNGIKAISFPRVPSDRERYVKELLAIIEGLKPDIIVMAGFMKILPDWFILKFPMKIVNTHPSLLPCFGGPGFYGHHVHEKVIESGARISGCTAHFVIPDVDAGPIILQRAVKVEDSDTPESLAGKVKEVEHEALVEAVSLVLQGNYRISGKRVLRPE